MLGIAGNLVAESGVILTEICSLGFSKSSKKTSVLLYSCKNVDFL